MSKNFFVVITGKYHYHYFKKKNLPVITITEKMKTRLPVLPERKDFSTVNKPCFFVLHLSRSSVFSSNFPTVTSKSPFCIKNEPTL